MELLGAVELAVFVQGVTFLYNQAGELLKRRRDLRKQFDVKPGELLDSKVAEEFAVLDPPAGVFGAVMSPSRPQLALLDQEAAHLLGTRQALEPCTLGDEELNSKAVEAAHELRRVMERIYNADLTFVGETDRSASSASTSEAQQGGVTAGTINVQGDFAGRDFHRYGEGKRR